MVMGASACSSDDSRATRVTEVVLVPDPTAVAPGGCDPAKSLATPSIKTAGTTTPATLGIGDFECGGVSGDGYITFVYNPVLIEGGDSIEVSVGDDVIATVAWAGTGAEPFVETDPGIWTASTNGVVCTRLTITLASTTGTSTATYGADVRVGGDEIECPQREIDPSDPSDIDPSVSIPPVPQTTDPPESTPATQSTPAPSG